MIILLGPPGCGKGTIATVLKTKYKYIHLSTGELIRSMLDENEDLRKLIKQGKFISDEKINELVEKYLSTLSNEEKEILILDGYPRTEKQAIFLKKLEKIEHVILIDIPEKVCIDRISNRNEGREDDNPQIAKKRWDDYIGITTLLIDFYSKEDILIKINGLGSKEEVLNEVLNILKIN